MCLGDQHGVSGRSAWSIWVKLRLGRENCLHLLVLKVGKRAADRRGKSTGSESTAHGGFSWKKLPAFRTQGQSAWDGFGAEGGKMSNPIS